MRFELTGRLPLLGLAATLLSGCSLGYLMEQGWGQAGLLLRQQPLRDALPLLPAREADKARLVLAAKDYARTSIGLRDPGSYERLVRLERESLSYVVSAAPRDRLEPYEWWFPVVGRVPYKGYFDRASAERERAALDAAGYDTHLRGVGAYSLLGFLPDPLYSSMLAYEAEDLANVVIHELTHATVFIRGHAAFNESFASFVGDEGSHEFYIERFGPDSAEVRQMLESREDRLRFQAFIAETSQDLEAWYAHRDLAPEALVAGRKEYFARALARLGDLPFHSARWRRVKPEEFNNAYLLLYRTYGGERARFQRLRPRFGSLRAMVAFFRDQVAREPEPEAWLDKWEAGRP